MFRKWFNKLFKSATEGRLEDERYRWTLLPNGFRQYYCPLCDKPLAPGPEGCGALNAKCKSCQLQVANLPYFWDRP